jgi:tetratricopeptide (TPR) repeat protein
MKVHILTAALLCSACASPSIELAHHDVAPTVTKPQQPPTSPRLGKKTKPPLATPHRSAEPVAPEPPWPLPVTQGETAKLILALDAALLRGEGSSLLISLQRTSTAAPQQAIWHCLMARIYLHFAQLDAATTAFAQAQALDDQLGWAWHGQALVHVARGELDQARLALEQAMAMDPHPRIAADLAWVLHRQGQHDAALARIDEIIAREPNQALFHLARAEMLSTRQQWSAAFVAVQRAIELAPDATAPCEQLIAIALAATQQESASRPESIVELLDSLASALTDQSQLAPQAPTRTRLEHASATLRLLARGARLRNVEQQPERHLTASDPVVRRHALTSMLATLERRHLPALNRALVDPDWQMRLTAARALAQVAAHDAIPALLRAARLDPNPEVRGAIAIQLGRLLAIDAVPALLQVLREEHESYAIEMLDRALQQITGRNCGVTLDLDTPLESRERLLAAWSELVANLAAPPEGD